MRASEVLACAASAWLLPRCAVAAAMTVSEPLREVRPVDIPLRGRLAFEGAVAFEVTLGAQTLLAVADTGSSTTAFACDACAQGACGEHAGHVWRASTSRSATPASCGPDCSSACATSGRCVYARRYAENSAVEGIFLSEDVALADGVPGRADVGCNTEERGLFRLDAAADGVAGLGMGPRSLLRALSVENFSLCLSEAGGLLTLGDAPDSDASTTTLRDAAATTTLRIASTTYWYEVDLVGVALVEQEAAPIVAMTARQSLRAGRLLTGGGGRATLLWPSAGAAATPLSTVIDSGSTFSYLPAAAVAAIVRGLTAACAPDERSQVSTRCGYTAVAANELPAGQTLCLDFHADGEPSARMPALELRFADGAVWRLSAASYLSEQAWFAPLRCLVLYDDRYARGRAIVGASLLRGARVRFDTRAGTLSYAPAACPLTHSRGSHRHSNSSSLEEGALGGSNA